MPTFAKGIFKPKNPSKYMGMKTIWYKSSWELVVMNMLDTNTSIMQWASESIKIPYKDPLTNRNTVYVPDFFVVYVDKNNKKHVELWEIKPKKQAFRESVGRSKVNQTEYIKNMAKWEACRIFCKQQNINFRILTEDDIFMKT